MPEGLFRNYVFLATFMTKPALHDCAAIQAVFFLPLGDMGQCKILIKNKIQINTRTLSFPYCSIELISQSINNPCMKNFFSLFLVFVSCSLHAQYYYNDIIATSDLNRLMQTYRDLKVRTVSAVGFDKQNVRSTDYSEFQEVRENGTVLKVTSINSMNKTVTYHRFDQNARIISAGDSAYGVSSTTNYTYDAGGKLTRITNVTADPKNDFSQTETHDWLYWSDGKPSKMWRIISSPETGTDSLEIRFVTDEQGNTGEERTFRRGIETGYLYYYYDDKNRISDVVRYNTKAKKLLPDMMFEYDDNDRAIQKITPTSSLTLGYLIWRYVFDERGLKTKEALFNDDKQITGKIEYSYTFGQ